MLKSLFNRIKSQKSEAQSNKKDKPHPPSQEVSVMKPIGSYQFSRLTELQVVDCPFERIRYSVEPDAPNVYNRVLSCPISVFNVLPYGKRKVKEIDLKVDPCPEYINHLKHLLGEELPTFNHILVNVYPPGVGIMPHFDGPLYFPKVVVLSLGGPAIITFTQNYSNNSKLATLLLEDQSIHIFQGRAYEKYLHGIADFTVDSIFLKVEKDSSTSQMRVVDASVSNFAKTRLFKSIDTILKVGQLMVKDEEEIDLTKQYGSACCLMPIRENPQYNYKVQLMRQERISITVRQKYPEK